MPANPTSRTLSSWLKNKMVDALIESAVISSNINVLPFREVEKASIPISFIVR